MRNLTLMTDLYQITMMQGYFEHGQAGKKAVFDLFFRKGRLNYAITAGLSQAIEYINNLKFTDEDITYLKGLNIFKEDFLKYLNGFKFNGDIDAVPEGTVVFAGEPILTVKADLIEAQLIESALLNIINHQTLIASKARRIKTAAGKAQIVEFGLRRAQGPDAGIYGTRASIIGGCQASSNVLAAKEFGIMPKGTHSHSWVLSYPTEIDAFRAFAESYPDSCLLLVDTYDTLKSGVPNAITVFNEIKAKRHKPVGIRIDSGDLSYLSKNARKMLDEAGFSDAIIFASGDIDENVLTSLIMQGAKIDVYGVGTKLITSEDIPSLGGVYKLVSIEEDGQMLPKMKLSDSETKMTNPGEKELYRLYDKNTKKALADLIALKGEVISKPLTIVHEYERFKKLTLNDYEIKNLRVPVFKAGKLVYDTPPLSEIVKHSKEDINTFWEEYKRLINPEIYKVDLSDGLYELKYSLLHKLHGG